VREEDDIASAPCVGCAAGPGTAPRHALRLRGSEGVQQLPSLGAGLLPRLCHCLIHVSNVAALHHTPRRRGILQVVRIPTLKQACLQRCDDVDAAAPSSPHKGLSHRVFLQGEPQGVDEAVEHGTAMPKTS